VIALSLKRIWMRLTVCKECSIVRPGSVATECLYRHKRLIHRNYGGCVVKDAPLLITSITQYMLRDHCTSTYPTSHQQHLTDWLLLHLLQVTPTSATSPRKIKCYEHNSSRPRKFTYWKCLVFNMPSTCHDCPRCVKIYRHPHVAHGPTVGPPCFLLRFL